MKRTVLTALAVGLLFGPAVRAQEDEPGRGVARLSLLNGEVSVRRGDSGDWVAAAVNAPLVVGDHVLTGSGSRAEIQLDWANMLRLSSDTDVRIATLENKRYQVQVAQGTVTLAVVRDSDADVEVDTPSVSVRPTRRGDYRVAVFENGESEVTVRSGEVEVYTPRGVERLRAGRTMLVRGTPSDPEYQIVDARSRDDWDRWNEERDRRLANVKSYAYVSRDIYGVDDLDAYGRWVYAPPYGYVWSPYGVGAGWAPYRDGRWAWVDYYGWSWIGYEPWGWAPYHYGRWFHHPPYGWCWYPGGRYARHYWSPGLVAFFGFNVGPVSVGFGFGRVGWVPLAPYETYHPWYGHNFYRGHRDGVYVDNSVRIVNNTNIVNVYRNARVINGVTGIDYDDFTRGRRGRAIGHDDIRNNRANLVQGALPITPSRDSQRLSDREMRMNTAMRPTNRPERFFTHNRPAQVERVSFEDQRRGMENLTRRTIGDRGAGKPGQGPAAVGWRGTGQPGNAGAAQTPGAGQGAVRPRAAEEAGAGGWRRPGERPAERTDNPAAARPGTVERENTPEANREPNRGWQRIGGRPAERTENPAAARPGTVERENTPEANRESNRGWQRFGGRPAERTENPAVRPGAAPRENTPERNRESNQGWQRFGGRPGERNENPAARPGTIQRENTPEPRRAEPNRPEPNRQEPNRQEPNRQEPNRQDSGGGQRFGNRPPERTEDPGRSQPKRNNFSAQGSDAGDGWRRFGGRSDAGPAIERSEPRYQAAPQWSRPERVEAPQWSRQERAEAPQWSRPERTESPRWSGGSSREPVRINPPIVRDRGGDYSRGGAGMSMPRGGDYSRGGGGVSMPRGGDYSRGGGGSMPRGEARSSGGGRSEARGDSNRGGGHGRGR